MDIISHTFTGVAIGTVVATASNLSGRKKGWIILLGGIGGAIPDFDAISLWSKFDSTIGSVLGLGHTGRSIYYGKFWYSHHGALHSVFAALFLLFIAFLGIAMIRREYSFNAFKRRIIRYRYGCSSFLLGYLLHLLEDMPTPSGPWGGVNLFFPSKTYIGGYGKIWWWNNYDLVLIIFTVIFVNLSINLFSKRYYLKKMLASIGVFIFGFSLFIFQINNRPIDFSNSASYQEHERESKRIQKDILGDRLYQFMLSVDNKIPLNF